MKVLKFGGTSVGTVESLKAVLSIVKKSYDAKEKPLVVLSAMSGVTNLLTQLAEDAAEGKSFSDGLKSLEDKHFTVVKELLAVKYQNPVFTKLKLFFNEIEDLLQGISALKELSNQSKDLILSYGERCSNYMVSKVMEQYIPESLFVDASHYVKTDSNFGNAHLNEMLTEQLVKSLYITHGDKLLFVTGFIGSNENGRITTLGRGGSDYTAAIFGSILDATAIEIWTDVNGMLTADPRIVKKAFSLPVLSYTEAMELSYFGAKVIYPPTMIPAFLKKIPIVIRNTFEPDFSGTVIQFDSGKTALPIKGISSISDISVINLSGSGMIGKSGFSGRLFTLLAREQINVVLITQSSSEHSITFAVNPSDAKRAIQLIEVEFELEIQANKLVVPAIEENLSVLAIVGENMKKTPGMAGRLFAALGRNGINVRAIAQGSSEYNISVIIGKEDLAKALNAVHDAFFAELKKTLHVFNIGTGNIGATLFKQLENQHDFLLDKNDIEIKVVGISNSRKMLFNTEGVDLNNWSDELAKNGTESDLALFIDRMKALNLPNCVFIDNTASKLPATYYEDIFKSNISIVTCNKIANSGKFEQYKTLRDTAHRHGVDFFYETNVGAGLPIVRVLKDLMLSGDRILKIEAILSGTISYIFNNFKADASFYDIVKQAQELGYTEPDPRDDLGGVDFMRKMLILARDAGYAVEAEDVDLGAILPPACLKADTVDSFYTELQQENEYFEAMKKKAANENKVIRYIGKLENGKVSIAIQFVDENHPFYALSGSDNIISFTTERYKERPLVVKGPGAGAEVTAAGVFADLVNVGA
ncbi:MULTISPECIES: bifunctional aspartate kinase/homoserine dehydrogenase I [Sphingobacterium]|jgi:bifunctional aspartokinase / homoserine dehydrogenase 1|uniref:Aspartokinase I/homoserine dehydrogenase I n=1 Tax=Sphingobacterium multivorum TaxID=28454 RepID=A0A2X2JBM5_SPHMU|nr:MULTISPECIES: bifunctional aspartate kinase/homoserine dehydrogenase I [Sphingobacterium]HAK31545.1 bifunctional aspartate kinase/homoserine dehydrogenase I [Sphingobacterium sp.]OFV17993.1 bifunctional aspartokinase I/homoserine dehydrogenase I [Sphingobacterium sp. HMSC13C05]OJZ06740.1 MAG: bifunctional aspartate kinase/homoserine dehydrogenase I [Sphingobacterium sp. 40-24]QQT64366.1 bifunctional aspartate kinase/homoserine dehydrogenase I [Sphingobacterium multivorum]QRQ60343.1 bifuncti